MLCPQRLLFYIHNLELSLISRPVKKNIIPISFTILYAINKKKALTGWSYSTCTCTLVLKVTQNYVYPYIKSKKFNSNIYQTRCNVTQFIISRNCSTCFGWYHHPSSRAQTTVSTASGICHTVTATCHYRGRVGTGLSVLWVAYA
jgi:hypothetical protein